MANQYEAEREKYHQHFVKDGSQGEDNASTELRNTPLFALKVKYMDAQPEDDVNEHQSDAATNDASPVDLFPPYALLGLHVGGHPGIGEREPIMLNTATPNSAFVCGSQGCGKSYTLACMLENCVLPDPDYGPVANPVAGVAFHYDAEGGKGIAEVASLCSRGIKVRVLVSRGNYRDRGARYEKLAVGKKDKMDVQILGFKDEHIDVERMKRLMAFSETADSGVPLYVAVIQKILREMNEAGNMVSFDEFERLLSIQEKSFAPSQTNMLHQRMEILMSFRHQPRQNERGKQVHEPNAPNAFETNPKTLTIVDFTDPFIDKATACVLFNICLELFKENKPNDGLAIILDEVHRRVLGVFSFVVFVLDSEGRQKLGTGVMKMKTRGRKGLDIGRTGMAGGEDDVVGDSFCSLSKQMDGLVLK